MSYVTVIGAATMDISAKSTRGIIPQDSNPGTIARSIGGVGRNVADNLARLSAPVRLMVAVGADSFGTEILEGCARVGIDVSQCPRIETASTSTYNAILDADGEMYVAVMDDSCLLTMAHIAPYVDAVAASELIVLDTNLSAELIGGLLDRFPQSDFYAETVSSTKAQKIGTHVGRFHTIKMNALEASVLAGMEIQSEADIRAAGDYFMQAGTKRVVISLGARGLYYRAQDEEIRLTTKPLSPKNATGAGDAMMAGLVYGSLMGKDAAYTAAFAQTMAQIALMSETTVSDEMSIQKVEEQMGGFTS